MALNKSSLSDRIYDNLESVVVPEMQALNCTEGNISDVKVKLRQQADSISSGVIDEIVENADVQLKSEVLTLKNAILAIIDAIVSSPTVPMDGGTSFKIGLISQLIPQKAQLALVLGTKSIE